jgi:hypothetical protein
MVTSFMLLYLLCFLMWLSIPRATKLLLVVCADLELGDAQIDTLNRTGVAIDRFPC